MLGDMGICFARKRFLFRESDKEENQKDRLAIL